MAGVWKQDMSEDVLMAGVRVPLHNAEMLLIDITDYSISADEEALILFVLRTK